MKNDLSAGAHVFFATNHPSRGNPKLRHQRHNCRNITDERGADQCAVIATNYDYSAIVSGQLRS